MYRSLRLMLAVSCVGGLALLSTSARLDAAPKFDVSETSIVKVGGMTVVKDSQSASPDARRFAFAVQIGDKQAAVVDGVVGPQYDGELVGIRFSPDSKRVVYSVKRDSKWSVVVDGVESAEYDSVSFDFSPDSERYAYVARDGNKCVLFTDRGKLKECDVWVDQYGTPQLGWPVFSPDSQRIAFAGAQGKQAMIDIDGVDGPLYDYCASPVFSPDSKRVGYAVWRGSKELVVVDGVEGKEYDDVAPNGLSFSPDSQHVVYAANEGAKWDEDAMERTGGQWYVVADGAETAVADEPFSYYSPDSKHVVSSVGTYPNEQILIDGEKIQGSDSVSGVGFSSDGSRMGYAAKRGGKSLVVIDGVEGPEQDGSCESPVFSPDSKRVEYQVESEGFKSGFIVVDGVAGPTYDHTQWFKFSPDSSHYAYEAKKGDKWVVVVDGVEAHEYDGLASSLVFDSPDALHCLAIVGGEEIRLVTMRVTGG